MILGYYIILDVLFILFLLDCSDSQIDKPSTPQLLSLSTHFIYSLNNNINTSFHFPFFHSSGTVCDVLLNPAVLCNRHC